MVWRLPASLSLTGQTCAWLLSALPLGMGYAPRHRVLFVSAANHAVTVVQRRGGVAVWAGELVFRKDANGTIEMDSALVCDTTRSPSPPATNAGTANVPPMSRCSLVFRHAPCGVSPMQLACSAVLTLR